MAQTITLPGRITEAMREAYHEIARREGIPLGDLIPRTMKERFPEVEEIVEQIVEAGGPDKFHENKYGVPRGQGPKAYKHRWF